MIAAIEGAIENPAGCVTLSFISVFISVSALVRVDILCAKDDSRELLEARWIAIDGLIDTS
jgi:hypothetical protein